MLNRDPRFMGTIASSHPLARGFCFLDKLLLTGLLVIVNSLSLVSRNIYLVA